MEISDKDRERFFSKVRIEQNGCWIWTGGKDKDGYGRISIKRKTVRAHRVAYQLFLNCEPANLLVLHRCDRPECVAPAHLFLGTNADNMRDMAQKARSTLGSLHPRAKFTEQQVTGIRTLYERFGITQSAIALSLGVRQSTISKLCRFQRWTHTPDAIAKLGETA
jgi:predicted XRE-type DNA-binding protein